MNGRRFINQRLDSVRHISFQPNPTQQQQQVWSGISLDLVAVIKTDERLREHINQDDGTIPQFCLVLCSVAGLCHSAWLPKLERTS